MSTTYLNEAIRAGFRLVRIIEPRVSEQDARRFAPAQIPRSGGIALEGLPILLVTAFERA